MAGPRTLAEFLALSEAEQEALAGRRPTRPRQQLPWGGGEMISQQTPRPFAPPLPRDALTPLGRQRLSGAATGAQEGDPPAASMQDMWRGGQHLAGYVGDFLRDGRPLDDYTPQERLPSAPPPPLSAPMRMAASAPRAGPGRVTMAGAPSFAAWHNAGIDAERRLPPPGLDATQMDRTPWRQAATNDFGEVEQIGARHRPLNIGAPPPQRGNEPAAWNDTQTFANGRLQRLAPSPRPGAATDEDAAWNAALNRARAALRDDPEVSRERRLRSRGMGLPALRHDADRLSRRSRWAERERADFERRQR